MKRKVALLISAVMLFVALMPVQIFAGNDADLQKAIVTAKQLFSISDDYKDFTYYMSSDGAKKSWSLNWNNSTENPGQSINVRIDEDEIVSSYYSYNPSDYSEGLKLPKVKKEDARKIAQDFIQKINPKVFSELNYDQDNSNDYSMYSFKFTRVANGLPVYPNYVSIQVSSLTGKVTNYNCEWSDGATFPDNDKAISDQEAQNAFIEKLGLKLIYDSNFDVKSKKMSISPVYTTVYDRTYCVDALTAEPVKIFSGFYGNGYRNEMYDKALSSKRVDGVSLSKEELDAIEKASKLITEEQAEKAVKDFKYLEITDEYKVVNSGLNPSWPDQSTFAWNIELAKETIGEDEKLVGSSHASVSINAATGEVISFSKYEASPDAIDSSKEPKPTFDREQSVKAVETFLKDNFSTKFSQVEYQENQNKEPRPLLDSSVEPQMPSNYNFSYVRKANGIPFPNNAITIYFNAVTGKIDNFNMTWFENASFPSIKKVMSIKDVCNKMFTDNKYELQYTINYKWDGYKIMPTTRSNFDVYMVYDLKSNIPMTFDAFTGETLDYNGKPYKEPSGIKHYSDIKGHYAEEKVTALSEIGISLPGDELKPDTDILQKDFVILMGYISGYVSISTPDPESQIDDLYNSFIQNGIIKKSEKSLDSIVKREDAVKFMIRILKYDKVADMKDIFVYPFKDIAAASPSLVGYITIAKALGIVNGDGEGYFAPKENLARAQAMVMVYNYLK